METVSTVSLMFSPQENDHIQGRDDMKKYIGDADRHCHWEQRRGVMNLIRFI